MHRLTQIIFASLVAITVRASAQAMILPASLFTNNAVLQQKQAVPVWGSAAANEPITVSINGQIVRTVADSKGAWLLKLAPMAAGGPYTMTIGGNAGDSVSLQNILIGEVWICGGQSNMAYCLKGWTPDAPCAAAIPTSTDPLLHFIIVPKTIAASPHSAVSASWQETNPETVGALTAVGYFFGRELRKALGVPIGLIHDNASGTVAQAWTRACSH